MDSLTADLRDAVRSIRRAPGVAIAAVAILALGIGANAAVWTALRASLLADLDAPEAERLVVARLAMADRSAASFPTSTSRIARSRFATASRWRAPSGTRSSWL